MHTDAVLELAGKMDPSVGMMGLLAEVEGRELSTRQTVRVFGFQAKVLAWMQSGHAMMAARAVGEAKTFGERHIVEELKQISGHPATVVREMVSVGKLALSHRGFAEALDKGILDGGAAAEMAKGAKWLGQGYDHARREAEAAAAEAVDAELDGAAGAGGQGQDGEGAGGDGAEDVNAGLGGAEEAGSGEVLLSGRGFSQALDELVEEGVRAAETGQVNRRQMSRVMAMKVSTIDPKAPDRAHVRAVEGRYVSMETPEQTVGALRLVGSFEEVRQIHDSIVTRAGGHRPPGGKKPGQARFDVAAELLLAGQRGLPRLIEEREALERGQGGDGPADAEGSGCAEPSGDEESLGSVESRDDSEASGEAKTSRPRRGGGFGPGPQMLVSIDLKTLVGLSNNPGLVLGEGPLGVEASRRMARSAPWRLMVMDPTFKELIDLGRAFAPAADILPPVTPKATAGPPGESGSPGGGVLPDSGGPSGGNGPPGEGGGPGEGGSSGGNGPPGEGGGRGEGGSSGGNGPPGGGLSSERGPTQGDLFGDGTAGSQGGPDSSLWPSKTLASNSYSASQRIRDLVAVRDQNCIVPSCQQPAMMCDLDHVVPYDPEKPADQQTRVMNLVPLCRHHHQLKTDGKWKYDRDLATGIITIRTVVGQEFTVPPSALTMSGANVSRPANAEQESATEA